MSLIYAFTCRHSIFKSWVHLCQTKAFILLPKPLNLLKSYQYFKKPLVGNVVGRTPIQNFIIETYHCRFSVTVDDTIYALVIQYLHNKDEIGVKTIIILQYHLKTK